MESAADAEELRSFVRNDSTDTSVSGSTASTYGTTRSGKGRKKRWTSGPRKWGFRRRDMESPSQQGSLRQPLLGAGAATVSAGLPPLPDDAGLSPITAVPYNGNGSQAALLSPRSTHSAPLPSVGSSKRKKKRREQAAAAPRSAASNSTGLTRTPYMPDSQSNMYHKYKYYGRLQQMAGHSSAKLRVASGEEGVMMSTPTRVWQPRLLPPPHVLPAYLFGLEDVTSEPQSSWATIMSIVNTMLGTTIVALPYAMLQTGIVLGTVLLCFIGCLACFTCILVIKRGGDFDTFTEFVGHHLGGGVKLVAWMTGIAVILGAAIVYHILMQMGIYRIVDSIGQAAGADLGDWTPTIAAFTVLILFPATIMKDLRALVKFNSFGFLFLWYCVIFIVFKGCQALVLHKVQTDMTPFVPPAAGHRANTAADLLGAVTFGTMSGTGTLAFFIHNIIHPITKNGDPRVVKRDIIIGFVIAMVVYVMVGVLGCFGLVMARPDVIHLDNILVIFEANDWFAVTAQISQVFQLMTVYPLLLLIIRTQVFEVLYHTAYPGRARVVVLSMITMAITLLFAIYLPNVSAVMRFCGAIGGLVVIFLVPIMADIKVRMEQKRMKCKWWMLHGLIILVGCVSLIAQFIPALTVG